MTEQKFKKVSVVGLGYIGLPTAAMFASRGMEVVGIDVNPQTVDTINRGKIHIVEPGLSSEVQKAVKRGYLRAAMEPESADAFLIAVPTPFKIENHEPDLRFLKAAVRAIAPVLKEGDIVILESTSPVGTTESMADWLAFERPDLTFPQNAGGDSDIRVAYCPERVLPGKILSELISNARLIGGMTPKCSAMASDLYSVFVEGDCITASCPCVAELAKLTENSFRDVNIAFANELSVICDKLDLDVWELVQLANHHPRVNVLQPGPGVGGHCIAVDPWFIVWAAPNVSRLIKTAREVNDGKPDWVLDKVEAAVAALCNEDANRQAFDVTIACYGLTYKPDTDDLRESPALSIVERLAARHPGSILVVEPNLNQLPKSIGRAKLTSFEEAAVADVHLALVDHTCFAMKPQPQGLRVDTRGIWSGTNIRENSE